MALVCQDHLHDWAGRSFDRYNHWGDVLVLCNVGVLAAAACQHYVTADAWKTLLLLCLFFYSLRGLMALLTSCRCDANAQQRQWIIPGPDPEVWFLLSGHTALTLLGTTTLWASSAPAPWKYGSWGLSALVIFFQAATREHYTVDVLLTAFMVALAYVGYIRRR